MENRNQIEISSFSKILSIWLIIIIVIIISGVAVGGQVYLWQQSVIKKERTRLERQIAKLKQEIKVLKSNKQKMPVNIAEIKLDKKSESLQELLAGREKAAISFLKAGDMERLAKLVHPDKGLRLAPFAYIDPEKNQLFSSRQVQHFFESRKRLIWGYSDEDGMPVKLNPEEYYNTYIYDRAYADTREITYNQADNSSFITGNYFEVYPQAIIVEYRVTDNRSKDTQNSNWSSIKLIFEEKKNLWYLVGINHEQWML